MNAKGGKNLSNQRAPLVLKFTGKKALSAISATLTIGLKAGSSLISFLLVLALIEAVLPVLGTWVGKLIIDAVVHTRNNTSALTGHTVRYWIIAELAIVATTFVLERVSDLIQQISSARLRTATLLLVLTRATELEVHEFESYKTSQAVLTARQHAGLPFDLINSILSIIAKSLMFAAYAFILSRFHYLMVIGLVVSGLPLFISEVFFSSRRFKSIDRRVPEGRRLWYLETVLGTDKHIKEICIFGFGPFLLSRFKTLSDSINHDDERFATRQATYGILLSIFSTVIFYFCYLAVALSAASGRSTIGQMTLYLVSIRRGRKAFELLLKSVRDLCDATVNAIELISYLAPSEKVLSKLSPTTSFETGIRFENVDFRYPNAMEPALVDISIFIPEGQVLAIVGENGSGKSTFVKLLMRMYAPTSGRILLDGRDIRDWNTKELRNRISVLFQDFSKFEFTLEDNVKLGDIDHANDRSQVLRALRNAGAHHIIRKLSNGSETMLGASNEKGGQLSEGQWQRVALARALMRENADILVLDEPTSALDPRSQHSFLQNFRSSCPGRTSILITHRFSTARTADRIVVLENGRVTEIGNHFELMELGGTYKKLFALDARGYK